MKIKVYLADLRHNFGGVMSIDTMPLSVGFMKSVMDNEFPRDVLESQIFAYPDALMEALKQTCPDVLMVSNYLWNEELSHFFVRRAKQLNGDTLTVMGGPNISNEPDRQVEYLAGRSQLDIYVTGEGDFLAAEIVRLFIESDCDIGELGRKEIPSCVYRRNGEVIRSETLPRRRQINEIPSPYLSGVLDEFFDGKLAPFIETNRGCPFKCKFCVQGTDFYNKVIHFDVDRVGDEIDYIGKRLHEQCPEMGTLRIADPNYGMYSRDVEVSERIGKAQKDYGWPTFIDATTGKNKPERIIDCLEKVSGALVLYQAVQSFDEEVLRNINRSNIKLDTYRKLMVHVKGRGLRSNSDLILGLPGETLKTHLDGLHGLVDAGIDQAHCFQAMVLKGSELEEIRLREQYKFITRYRIAAKSYGIYGGEMVFDTEEIIVGTNTLPFEDYLTCRKHHLAFSIFWNDSWFYDVVQLVKNLGVKPSEWLVAMLDAMAEEGGEIKKLLDEFVDETINELFLTREACVEFYSEQDNFRRLKDGEIGDNLMYKYRARASFLLWKELCHCTLNATERLLREHSRTDRMVGFDGFFNDLSRYVEARHADGTTLDELSKPVEMTLDYYDIARWVADEYPVDVSAYHLAVPGRFSLCLSDVGLQEMSSAFKVWSSELVGLTKLVVRIRVSSQVRDVMPVER